MRCCGKILGFDNDSCPTCWLVELDDDGTPRLDFRLIPAETLPDVVSVWTIGKPIDAEDRAGFTLDESAKLALQVMRRAPMRK